MLAAARPDTEPRRAVPPLLRRAALHVGVGFAVLLVAGLLAWHVLPRPTAPGSPYYDPTRYAVFNIWSRWDSNYYASIAQHGYTDPESVAFFPAWPLLAAPWVRLGVPFWLAGPLLAMACAVIGFWLFGEWVAEVAGRDVGPVAQSLLAFFPTAFFFWTPYPCSLYLACTAGSLLLARRRRYLLSGAAAAVACLTWNFGLALAVALPAGEYIRGSRGRSVLALLLPWVALGAFAVYSWAAHGSPMALPHAADFYWNRVPAPPWALFVTTVRGLVHVPPHRWDIAEWTASDLTFGTAYVVMVAYAFRRQWITPTERLYCFLAAFIPFISNSPLLPSGLSGMARYMLANLPAFAALAPVLLRCRWRLAVLPLLVLQVGYFALYARGWWVA